MWNRTRLDNLTKTEKKKLKKNLCHKVKPFRSLSYQARLFMSQPFPLPRHLSPTVLGSDSGL